jgi:hypothetical protein
MRDAWPERLATSNECPEKNLLDILDLSPYTGHEFLLKMPCSLGLRSFVKFIYRYKSLSSPANICRLILGFKQAYFEIGGALRLTAYAAQEQHPSAGIRLRMMPKSSEKCAIALLSCIV